jgi:hypothetical protein
VQHRLKASIPGAIIPKINSKNWRIFQTGKSELQQTTFATLSATTSPQNTIT